MSRLTVARERQGVTSRLVGEEDMRPPHRKHSGRRVGPTSSQQVILDAARAEFSARGFEGTTMRVVAQSAGVDAALIHHFFLSKGGLFSAAVQDVLCVPDLVQTVGDGPREQAGQRLAGAYIAHWEDPDIRPRLVGLLRSASAFEGATEVIQEFFGRTLMPVASAAGQGRPELRAALCGSFLLGAAALRYVTRSEPTVSLSPGELVRIAGGTCQAYLFDRL
jgi:AcrR family transcriptional regulator